MEAVIMDIKDKNGELIEDGDSFHYNGTTPPVIGTREGNTIKWSDGMEIYLNG